MSAGTARLAVATIVVLALTCASAPRPAEAQVATCDGQIATIVGTPGPDTLDGTPGADVIAGLAGADTIQGVGGDDIICGDDGDDGISPGVGDDIVDGGTGDDVVSFGDLLGGVTASLATGVATNAGDTDSLVGIESIFGGVIGPHNLTGDAGPNRLVGSIGNDVILGGGGSDSISGLDGDDTIDGGSENDSIDGGLGDDDLDGGSGSNVVSYGDRPSGVTVSMSTGTGGSTGESDTLMGFDWLYGSSGPDVLIGDAGVDRILGLGGNDTIHGGPGPQELRGGDGNDTIYGNDGDDVVVAEDGDGDDALDGGAGIDEVNYSLRTSAVTASLRTGVAGGAGESDSLVGVENLLGSHGPDTLIGDAGPNQIAALGGDDTVIGGLGDDQLFGGLWFSIPQGTDTVSYRDHSEAVTASLDSALPFSGQGGSAGESDTLSGFSSLEGGSGPDVLTGDAGPNTIVGGDGDDTLSGMAGDDRLDGGAGLDTISYADATGVSASLATQVGGRPGEADTLLGAEALTGGPGADVLAGDAGANRLDGGPGDDAVDGGLGADTVAGAAGSDRLTGGDGNDALDGGADADSFAAGDGNDVLEARDGVADSLFDCGPGIDTLRSDSPADDATTRSACELPAAPPPPPAVLAALSPVTDPALPPLLTVSTPCKRPTPSRGRCGDGQPGLDARLAAPSDVAVAADGSIVIADTLNNVIRLLRRRDGRVFTIAGTGARGLRNGPAGQAQFDAPAGVAIWPGRGVLVADTGNDVIRLIAAKTGQVSTLVSAQGPIRRGLQRPRDVLGLPNDRMLIADTGNHQVLGVSPQGTVSVLAGSRQDGYSGEGAGAENARLSNPSQLAFAHDGSLLIADTGNGAIRRVAGLGSRSTKISTVIRDLDGPRGVLDLPGGNVLVGDDSRLLLVVPGKRPITVAGERRRGADGDGPRPGPPLNAVGQLADLGDGFIAVPERGGNTVSIAPRPTPHTRWKSTPIVGRAFVEAGLPINRLRRPPPDKLFPPRYARAAGEDYGDCFDARRFQVKLLPAGRAGTPVKLYGGRLRFKAGVRATVVLELFRGRRVSGRNRASAKELRPVRVRRGTRRTPRLGDVKGKGYYDAVLWGFSLDDQEVRCDVRQVRIR